MFLTVLRLRKVYDKAVKKDGKMLKFVYDYFKKQEMLEKVI